VDDAAVAPGLVLRKGALRFENDESTRSPLQQRHRCGHPDDATADHHDVVGAWGHRERTSRLEVMSTIREYHAHGRGESRGGERSAELDPVRKLR
jgi:hypothetical protein